MRDPIYADELRHDTEHADATPYLSDALDSIVDDLMRGEKVPGLKWGLQDFLDEQGDLYELVSSSLITRGWTTLEDIIEKRLRAELEDSDAVHDKAAEFANEQEGS